MNLGEYLKAKQKIEQLSQEANRSEGAINQLLSQLEALGIENAEQAENYVKKLEKEIEDKEKYYNKLLEDWNKEYADSI